MDKLRLTTLADGIFAIVMTLMVLNFHVPALIGTVTNGVLGGELLKLAPVFTSYLLSFSILVTYWMAHHYIISIYATNIDRRLVFWNMPFLMAVSLVPFSTHLLGTYSNTPLSIWVYSGHIIIVGALLHHLFHYALRSTNIKNPSEMTQKDIRFTDIRIFMPPVCAVLAVALSFFNTTISIYFLVFGVVFNLIPGVLHALDRRMSKAGVTVLAIPKRKSSRVKVRQTQTPKTEGRVLWVVK